MIPYVSRFLPLLIHENCGERKGDFRKVGIECFYETLNFVLYRRFIKVTFRSQMLPFLRKTAKNGRKRNRYRVLL